MKPSALLPATRRFAAVCLGVLALCLALPFAVFALWDRALCTRPQPLPADPAALSAAGRQNPTACLLYTAAHVTDVRLDNTALYEPNTGWTAAAAADLPALCRTAAERLSDLAAAGLLDEADAAAAAAALTAADGYAWSGGTAPGGLTMVSGYPVSATPETAASGVSLTVAWTDEGVPVLVRLGMSDRPLHTPASADALAAYLALTGLDAFTDWQPIDFGADRPDAGAAAYSPEAQLYVAANTRGGLTVSAASIPPDEMARLTDRL